MTHQMKKINSKTIKLDYCEKIRDLNRMRIRLARLEDENALLRRQREEMRAEKLVHTQALATNTDEAAIRYRAGLRRGLLIGLMLCAMIYTTLMYAATH